MGITTRYWMIDSVILLILLITLAYFYVTRKFNYWKKRGVTEIEPTPFIGNFGDCLMAKRSAGQWLKDLYDHSAGLPYMGFYIFDRPALLVRDPELIKNILIRETNVFQNRFATASRSDPLGFANLFFIKAPAWKILRSKITPIYTSGKLKRMFELMLEIGDDLDAYMNSLSLNGNGENLDMKEISARFTTDMIATTAFGIRVNSLNNPDSDFRRHGKNMFRVTAFRNFEFTSMFFLPGLVGPLGLRFFSHDSTRFLRHSMWDVLTARERSGTKRNDLIDLLVELRKAQHESSDKGIFEFDGDNLVAQTAVFFTAGFETSSSTMNFSLYELAMNPDIQSKLRTEIMRALEETGGRITYDLTMALPYLDMVVAETLRKYPSLPFLDRVANDDYKIPDYNLVIEKGTPVYIPMMGLHYDPKYFPDPHEFDPERFSDQNKRGRKPCVYFPFGEGPHSCIGMRIGLLQTKLGLIKFLTNYEFSPCEDTSIPLRLSSKSLLTSVDSPIILNVKKIAIESSIL